MNGEPPVEDEEFKSGKWRFKNWNPVLSKEAFVLVNSMLNTEKSDRIEIEDVITCIWMRCIANSNKIDIDAVRLDMKNGTWAQNPEGLAELEITEKKAKDLTAFNNSAAEAMEDFQNLVKLDAMFKGTILIC